MKIYVASSWRNDYQPEVVKALRDAGHEVYDFKNPPKKTGFGWEQVDPNWKSWNTQQYLTALNHKTAQSGFNSDFSAMREADVCILVMPCGRSAHIEAGFMVGEGKPTAILLNGDAEAELMYKMCDLITDSLDKVINWAKELHGIFGDAPLLTTE